MYSRARIAGHPIHPMVVGFPIALFTATLACLLVYIGTHDTFYYRAAMVASLSGVTMAALAAIPGAIDLLSLPTGSRARRVGIKHGSYALATVGMFAIAAAVLYRNWAFKTMIDGEWQLDATVPLAIATVGMVRLSSSDLSDGRSSRRITWASSLHSYTLIGRCASPSSSRTRRLLNRLKLGFELA